MRSMHTMHTRAHTKNNNSKKQFQLKMENSISNSNIDFVNYSNVSFSLLLLLLFLLLVVVFTHQSSCRYTPRCTSYSHCTNRHHTTCICNTHIHTHNVITIMCVYLMQQIMSQLCVSRSRGVCVCACARARPFIARPLNHLPDCIRNVENCNKHVKMRFHIIWKHTAHTIFVVPFGKHWK